LLVDAYSIKAFVAIQISADVMCISIYVLRVELVVNPRPRPCSIIDYYEPCKLSYR